jgi:hypothetical protein
MKGSPLVGELVTQSEAFRTRWAAHDVRFHNTGVKHFNHRVVSELSLTLQPDGSCRRRRAALDQT